MSDLEEQVAALAADGWQIVGQGKVLIPYEAKYPKPSFAERVEGFHGVASGEMLLDDDEQWFQLRHVALGEADGEEPNRSELRLKQQPLTDEQQRVAERQMADKLAALGEADDE